VVQADGRGVLSKFARLFAEAGVPFAPYVTQARQVDEAIVDAARECGCDIIVMVTHGCGAFGELMWGSHTENVWPRCDLPLLALH
jgi:nucleotide-binding universal stress UspA family protein